MLHDRPEERCANPKNTKGSADVEQQIRAKLIPAKATMNRGVEAKEPAEAAEA